MEYWEEQQLKQSGYFEEAPKPTAPDPMAGQSALEGTLQEVKKTLWNMERHTNETQSRLDVNNKSGPTFHIKKMTRWAAEDWAIDMIGETLVELQHTLETSSIARHSKSPLEASLDSLKESTVSFNERTMRWHDDQTNLMVKGTDPRVAEAMKPKPSDEMVTKKKTGIGVLAGFLKEIAESNSLIAKALAGTAEDKLEGTAAAAKAAKEEKKQTGIFGGMLEALKKTAVGSWLIDNWKMIAATLFVLFAPLKWIKKLWGWAKTFWDMPIWGKILSALGLIATYMLAKRVAGKAMDAIVSGGSRALGAARAVPGTVLQKATAGGQMTAAQKAMSAQRATATKAVPTKGIFGKIVEKFGKAGKWIKQLGSRFIMPLITTPAGWAILAGLAIGGLVYAYWDEIKAGVEKAFGFLTKAIDSLKEKFAAIDIGSWIKALIGRLPDFIAKPLLSLFGDDKEKPIKDTGVYAEGPTPDDIKDKVAKKGLSKGAWMKQQAGGGGEKQSAWMKSMGGKKGVKQAYKKYKSGFGGGPTAAPTPSTTPPASPIKGHGEGVTIQEYIRYNKAQKQQAGGEDKHKAVKVSQADMSGVSWNKLGGRDTIEDAILTTWNQAGVSATPTFTSGFRNKDHALSKSNPRSQHIQKTAFDLRSSDLGSNASTVWADISNKFAGMGLWGQWEKGSVNEGKRTGEHFHFQLASRGFNGIVGKDGPRGFIAGEAGEELVRIQPLVSPDDKMNAMNALNAENQTIRGQSGSPTIINTNASSSTTNAGDFVGIIPKVVSAPRLKTSLPS